MIRPPLWLFLSVAFLAELTVAEITGEKSLLQRLHSELNTTAECLNLLRSAIYSNVTSHVTSTTPAPVTSTSVPTTTLLASNSSTTSDPNVSGDSSTTENPIHFSTTIHPNNSNTTTISPHGTTAAPPSLDNDTICIFVNNSVLCLDLMFALLHINKTCVNIAAANPVVEKNLYELELNYIGLNVTVTEVLQDHVLMRSLRDIKNFSTVFEAVVQTVNATKVMVEKSIEPDYTLIIIICVFGGVMAIGLVCALLFIIVKRCTNKDYYRHMQNETVAGQSFKNVGLDNGGLRGDEGFRARAYGSSCNVAGRDKLGSDIPRPYMLAKGNKADGLDDGHRVGKWEPYPPVNSRGNPHPLEARPKAVNRRGSFDSDEGRNRVGKWEEMPKSRYDGGNQRVGLRRLD